MAQPPKKGGTIARPGSRRRGRAATGLDAGSSTVVPVSCMPGCRGNGRVGRGLGQGADAGAGVAACRFMIRPCGQLRLIGLQHIRAPAQPAFRFVG